MTLTDDEVEAIIRKETGWLDVSPLATAIARHFYALGLTAERSQRAAHVRAYDAGLAAIPREPTQAMQEAGASAMFVEGGDMKRSSLMLIVRKGWRAMWDAAQERP